MWRTMLGLVVLAVCVPLSSSAAEPTEAQVKAFTGLLTGTTMVGHFSIDGRDGSKIERYEISKAEKIEGTSWVITARIKYGDKDVELPVVVKVFWADDTPVLSLTNLTLPGLGTFTSRVMFYGDRYAGTWQHDAVGGHMWGKLEKTDKATKPKEASK